MSERITLPELTTVQCPACHQRVGLPYSGELVPFHWIQVAVGRVSCPGEGSVVLVSAFGLVAVQPEPAGEVSG